MTLPFTVSGDLVEADSTSIYILRNVISNEKMQDIKKIIDKNANSIEEYSESCNVKSTYVRLQDIEHYNPKIYQEINRTFEYIRNEIETSICPMKTSVDYCGMQLRKIHGPTRIHIDTPTGINKIRWYSVIVALNNDYEGGELSFPRQDLKIKLKAGEALIFPPYWTHPHGTTDLLNGTFRYTINTWLY